jgi:hypothetical protein
MLLESTDSLHELNKYKDCFESIYSATINPNAVNNTNILRKSLFSKIEQSLLN